jgi:hypothetical protein
MMAVAVDRSCQAVSDPRTRLNWTAIAVWSAAGLFLLVVWSIPAMLFSRAMP